MSCMSLVLHVFDLDRSQPDLLGDRRSQLGGPVGMTIDPEPGDLGDASERRIVCCR